MRRRDWLVLASALCALAGGLWIGYETAVAFTGMVIGWL